MKTEIVVSALRVALIGALVVGGWSIYHQLPSGGPVRFGVAQQASRETMVRVTLRRTSGGSGEVETLNVPIQIYPVDVAAAQREYLSERRAGLRFEDFLKRFVKDRPPIQTQLDEGGRGAVLVPPGRWWIHATLEGTQATTWRLPVSVSGRELTVELTPENAYTRTESF